MKASRDSLPGQLDRPSTDIRLYLFHGPDEAGSRAHGQRLLAGLGADRLVLAAEALRSDAQALADEASALGLFGGRRALWIDGAGDELASAAALLLERATIEHPAILIAGALRKTSPLVKLAEASPLALAWPSYTPEGRDAAQMVIELGRREGLRIGSGVAQRLAALCGNDRGIAALELAKLALFLDCAPASPRELEHDALDALAADHGAADLQRLGDLALAGDIDALVVALGEVDGAAGDPLQAVRALHRRLLMLAPLRARVERGEQVAAVMASAGKSLFWRDKPLIGQLLARYDSALLARLIERAAQLEMALMRSSAPREARLGEELLAIARSARRRVA